MKIYARMCPESSPCNFYFRGARARNGGIAIEIRVSSESDEKRRESSLTVARSSPQSGVECTAAAAIRIQCSRALRHDAYWSLYRL